MNGHQDQVRPLPRHEQHRGELLAVIREVEERESPWRRRRFDLAGLPGRAARAGWPGWITPVAAAAAVLLIAGLTAGVHALMSAGGHQAAAGTGKAVPSRPQRTGIVTASQAPPSPAGGGQWKVTRQYQVTTPVTSLVVDNPVGAVTIIGGATTAVSVTATIDYRGAAPSSTPRVSGHTLTVSYGPCTDCGAAFYVTVPRGVSVTVHEGTGQVTLSSLAGEVSAQSGTGNVTGTGLSGATGRFQIGTGRVDVAYAKPPRQVSVVASTGAVQVLVPASVAYRVSAGSEIGAVDIAVPQSPSASRVISVQDGVGAVTVAGTGG